MKCLSQTSFVNMTIRLRHFTGIRTSRTINYVTLHRPSTTNTSLIPKQPTSSLMDVRRYSPNLVGRLVKSSAVPSVFSAARGSTREYSLFTEVPRPFSEYSKVPMLYQTHSAMSKAYTTSSAVEDPREARPFSEIPGPTSTSMVLNMFRLFIFNTFSSEKGELKNNLQPFFDMLMDEYGPIVKSNFNEPTVLIEDPADIEIVFKNEGRYPKRQVSPIFKTLDRKKDLTLSIVEAQGEEWLKMRSPLNPLLMRAKSAQHYLPAQNQVADDLVARLKKPFSDEELDQILYRYACESISVVAYNKRIGYLDPDIDNHPEKLRPLADIRAIFDAMTKSFNVHPTLMKVFPFKFKKDFIEAASRLQSDTRRLYEETMESFGEEQKGGNDEEEEQNFLRSLLTSGRMDADAMASIANSLFIAGTDSTARNLHLTLYNLARKPDKQQKLFEEIVRVIGPDGALTEEAMDNMKYLVACVKESFRLIYPTIAGTQRYLHNDVIMKGFRIPAGTSILMMNQRAVKNPKYFPDPQSYLPERWLRDEEGKRETPVPFFAHIPFGFGPRQCVGKRFAEQEIYLALTKLIQSFQISLDKDQKRVAVNYTPFAGPSQPIKFTFTERKNS